ncbi:MAG TPA: molybdenum cofactor guanylyltransferase [Dehalococcoidales bacterium]|nr:molybdenum cofactor guanylyltransferase [Dehalococcoidales bacterium]
MNINCIVLAGGKSTRLGRDKVSEKIGDRSLLEQVINRIDPISKEIIIVTAKERAFAELAGRPNIKFITDIIPGQGSLGGIYSGLVKSDSYYNIVLAADMPFVNAELLRYMAEVSQGYDFVLPRVEGLFEPLHAIYSKDCIGPIEKIFQNGSKVIIELFNYVKVRYIEVEEINKYDPQHLSFFNINTNEELERAKQIAAGTTH